MKKSVFVAIFAAVSLCCDAQFVLTPSAGLMTEEGAYTILREGTESENYYVVKKAVESAFPNADIGELDYEKSFVVSILHKRHSRLFGAMVAGDWEIEFKLKIEAQEGKILISYEKVGTLKWDSKGNTAFVFPTTGKNSTMLIMANSRYIFNSKGQVAKNCKKAKELYEDIANGIVKDIENNLK